MTDDAATGYEIRLTDEELERMVRASRHIIYGVPFEIIAPRAVERLVSEIRWLRTEREKLLELAERSAENNKRSLALLEALSEAMKEP